MITGHTKLAAVLATPIKHSLSPLIHNTAFEALGIDAVYLAFDVGLENLAAAFETIRHFNLLGVNLSMPNKQLGFELVDEVSDVARLVKSINTVVNQNGKLVGYNTDGLGFMASLLEADIQVIGKKMLIIGTGGASLAIIAQAAFDGVAEIAVFRRGGSKFKEAEAQLSEIGEATSCLIKCYPLEDETLLKKQLNEADLLVNATNVGMSPNEHDNLIASSDWLRADLAVADIVYQPLETALLKMAKEKGCQRMNGLGMLIHQGAAAFKLWTGQEMPIEAVRLALMTK